MTRLTWLVLLGCVGGCHAEPAAPTPPPLVATPAADPTPEPTIGTSETSELEPLPAVASGSPCERSCARLHGCVIAQGERGVAAAASIELGCLAACVQDPGPDAGTSLFGCELPPAPSQPDSCAPFLECVGGAWPSKARPLPEGGSIPLIEATGCERACWAYARCEDKADTDEDERNIERCIEKCGQILDDEQELILGQCASLPDCRDIEHCVLSTPGA
ncbi:hypothetical protein [Enhygromyxa salina]|uniref:Uncharacterized protein n=1 Tax=Enhygromyxa salina TaxID=215803 RepID=A0A2S9YT13_9BACT|nr:hypothetical protein [Enhygromyxa salina]PRQ08255.1 hypothetical protein ENSA7_18770 [Enhygromyxa salina]